MSLFNFKLLDQMVYFGSQYTLMSCHMLSEQVFGLEYDLDLFNVVAVPDFNM